MNNRGARVAPWSPRSPRHAEAAATAQSTKTADNRYWQNQFRVDDAELEAPAEFEEYAPPSLGAAADDDRDAPDASSISPTGDKNPKPESD